MSRVTKAIRYYNYEKLFKEKRTPPIPKDKEKLPKKKLKILKKKPRKPPLMPLFIKGKPLAEISWERPLDESLAMEVELSCFPNRKAAAWLASCILEDYKRIQEEKEAAAEEEEEEEEESPYDFPDPDEPDFRVRIAELAVEHYNQRRDQNQKIKFVEVLSVRGFEGLQIFVTFNAMDINGYVKSYTSEVEKREGY